MLSTACSGSDNACTYADGTNLEGGIVYGGRSVVLIEPLAIDVFIET